MATKYNMTVEQGATYSRVLRYIDSAGTPVNLTGWAVRGEVRGARSRSANLFERLSLDLTNPAGGEITLTIPATRSSLYRWKKGYYDIELVASDGETVTRLLEGEIKVVPEVTVG